MGGEGAQPRRAGKKKEKKTSHTLTTGICARGHAAHHACKRQTCRGGGEGREAHFQCRTRLPVARENRETRMREKKKERRKKNDLHTSPGRLGTSQSGAEIKSRADHFTGPSLTLSCFIYQVMQKTTITSEPSRASTLRQCSNKLLEKKQLKRKRKKNTASLHSGVVIESYYVVFPTLVPIWSED